MPESRRSAPLLAESGLSAATIAEQRAALDAMAATSPPPEGVAVEPVTLAGRSGEWLTPEAGTADGVVLYLHGGGYCIGSLGSHRGLGSRLAMAAGCPVVTLDYRLAPEHPFPAAVDDATGAYRDLLAIGADPEQIAIAGDSAGGGLTVATLLALRAAGTPLPAAAVCLSPWADLTQSSPAYARIGRPGSDGLQVGPRPDGRGLPGGDGSRGPSWPRRCSPRISGASPRCGSRWVRARC